MPSHRPPGVAQAKEMAMAGFMAVEYCSAWPPVGSEIASAPPFHGSKTAKYQIRKWLKSTKRPANS